MEKKKITITNILFGYLFTLSKIHITALPFQKNQRFTIISKDRNFYKICGEMPVFGFCFKQEEKNMVIY